MAPIIVASLRASRCNGGLVKQGHGIDRVSAEVSAADMHFSESPVRNDHKQMMQKSLRHHIVPAKIDKVAFW